MARDTQRRKSAKSAMPSKSAIIDECEECEEEEERQRENAPRENGTQNGDFPCIRFECGGWCNELNRDYAKGVYRPKDEREYMALRKYGKEV